MTIELPAITLWEPYATFIVSGLKRIETRNWATHKRGRFAVHAAASRPVDCSPSTHHSAFTPAWRTRRDGDQWVVELLSWDADMAHVLRTIPLHPGKIVGSAVLVDVRRSVQITADDDVEGWQLEADVLGYPTGRTLVSTDEQRIYGDLVGADRVAWLLASTTSSVEACPLCGGSGRADRVTPCPVCAGVGHCQPIPAKGRQGWWTWKP
jgi:hypothetical protein